MNEAFLAESGTQLIDRLIKLGYRTACDRTSGKEFRTVVMSKDINGFTHAVCLEISIPDDPSSDEVMARSFHRDGHDGFQAFLDRVRKTGRLPEDCRNALVPAINTALIDGRLYTCQNWLQEEECSHATRRGTNTAGRNSGCSLTTSRLKRCRSGRTETGK